MGYGVVPVLHLPRKALEENSKPGSLLNDFLSYMKEKQNLMHGIERKPWAAGTAVPSNSLLLVPCVAASRIGSDISAAYSNLEVPGIYEISKIPTEFLLHKQQF